MAFDPDIPYLHTFTLLSAFYIKPVLLRPTILTASPPSLIQPASIHQAGKDLGWFRRLGLGFRF